MTVEELIQKLSQYPKDTPIYLINYARKYLTTEDYYNKEFDFEDLFAEVDYGKTVLEVVR